jgi:hypothetical protein
MLSEELKVDEYDDANQQVCIVNNLKREKKHFVFLTMFNNFGCSRYPFLMFFLALLHGNGQATDQQQQTRCDATSDAAPLLSSLPPCRCSEILPLAALGRQGSDKHIKEV